MYSTSYSLLEINASNSTFKSSHPLEGEYVKLLFPPEPGFTVIYKSNSVGYANSNPTAGTVTPATTYTVTT